MGRRKVEEPVKPDYAQCWVCLERGVKKMYPIEDLQDCTQGIYRCKNHKGATILNAGKVHEEKKQGKRFVITIPEIRIEVEVI